MMFLLFSVLIILSGPCCGATQRELWYWQGSDYYAPSESSSMDEAEGLTVRPTRSPTTSPTTSSPTSSPATSLVSSSLTKSVENVLPQPQPGTLPEGDELDQAYLAWKELALAATAENTGVEIRVTNELLACVSWYNSDVANGTCSVNEEQVVGGKMQKLMDGIIEASGFLKVLWEAILDYKNGKRLLRGHSRADELLPPMARNLYSATCSRCTSVSYLCSTMCAYRARRRLIENTKSTEPNFYANITGVEAIVAAETLAVDTKQNLEEQCQYLMRLMSFSSFDLSQGCREGLRKAVCVADNVHPSLIVGVQGPDGSFETAADYIARGGMSLAALP